MACLALATSKFTKNGARCIKAQIKHDAKSTWFILEDDFDCTLVSVEFHSLRDTLAPVSRYWYKAKGDARGQIVGYDAIEASLGHLPKLGICKFFGHSQTLSWLSTDQ